MPTGTPHGAPHSQPAIAPAPPEQWLRNTRLLQIDHPQIRLLAKKLTALAHTPRDQALRCYSHVRRLPFACVPASTRTTATAVLRSGQGDCHTKSTLLVALLRALGIPARMRFLTLGPAFLHGLVPAGGPSLEHACVEVWLDGGWQQVDSHVADPPLAAAARRGLRRDGRALGYGLHLHGQISWSGKGDSIALYSPDDANSLPVYDWGVFDDPGHFYATAARGGDRLCWRHRLQWWLGAALVNHRVRQLRNHALRRRTFSAAAD